jgi:quercetin dioxygenase-like cupin family protein
MQNGKIIKDKDELAKVFDMEHHFSDGLYAKKARIKPGQWLVQHKHNYEHLSVLAQGRCLVTVDGKTTEYVAPAMITIVAGAEHKIFAIEETVWFCIHATEATTEDEVFEQTVVKEI